MHRGDAGCDCRLRGTLRLGLDGATPKHGERRNDFALNTLFDNRKKELPDIGRGLEVVAAVADAAVNLHQVPVLQLLQARAHVGPCNGKSLRDLLRRERFA
jgi:hypothetical protein